MSLQIEDYALIGDCQTGAMVGCDGSVDWLCLPRFDSPACFAALLGDPGNGRWLLAPRGSVRKTKRRYRPDTLILETEFETDEGRVRLVDFMPPRGEAPDLVRIVEGLEGSVSMQMELAIRFDYGSAVPWVRRRPDGLWAIAGPQSVWLRTPVDLRGENFRTLADFKVGPGERVPFTMTWHPSFRPPPKQIAADDELKTTEQWWHRWGSRCTYDGPWRDEVSLSLRILKALTYEPTGGIVAAVTTSLPEQLGGVRNWDYRYCWIRDATLTLYAMMTGGYHEEACQWRDWLLRAIAGSPNQMQIMYGLGGERRLAEWEVPWLSGYADSKPVRVGNGASQQFQLDVYGELMDALQLGRRVGLPFDENAWRLQRQIMAFLEKHWSDPDEGIWEVRGPRRQFTYSKVMAWVAFDRAINAVEEAGLDGPVERWRHIRDRIHAEVCQRGFNHQVNSFVQYYGADHPDAALLNLTNVGFLPPDDPRVAGTIAAIGSQLDQDGFILRYPTRSDIDGLPPGEGAFLACSFWYVDALVQQKRYDEAHRRFERLLGLCNDVGLLAEEYDAKAGRQVGNVPQAFSHVALVNSARSLAGIGGPAQARKQKKAG